MPELIGRPYRLNDGTWGALIKGENAAKRGDDLVVVTRGGKRMDRIVNCVVWSKNGRTAVSTIGVRITRAAELGGYFDANDPVHDWPNHDCIDDFGCM